MLRRIRTKALIVSLLLIGHGTQMVQGMDTMETSAMNLSKAYSLSSNHDQEAVNSALMNIIGLNIDIYHPEFLEDSQETASFLLSLPEGNLRPDQETIMRVIQSAMFANNPNMVMLLLSLFKENGLDQKSMNTIFCNALFQGTQEIIGLLSNLSDEYIKPDQGCVNNLLYIAAAHNTKALAICLFNLPEGYPTPDQHGVNRAFYGAFHHNNPDIATIFLNLPEGNLRPNQDAVHETLHGMAVHVGGGQIRYLDHCMLTAEYLFNLPGNLQGFCMKFKSF